ncbi:MAG: GNAT family N-acetyltransferase [bacterium]|nr:GNAT family N-acetyltransferase [bacterium]
MKKQVDYKKKIISASRVMRLLKPGNRIFINSGIPPEHTVKNILKEESINYFDLEFIQLFSVSKVISPAHCEDTNFRLVTFRTGESGPPMQWQGRIDFIPANLIEIPFMFATGAIKVDIAILTASPPDSRGYMSLGIIADVARIVIKRAATVIVEINPNMPVTYGDTSIHVDQVDYLVKSKTALPVRKIKKIDAVLDRIGWHVSNLIRDGSTVVLHVGSIFDAIAHHLKNKKNLGIITNVISDWAIDLIESGAISLDRDRDAGGRISTSYCYGTKKLYNYLHLNQFIGFYPIAKLANPNNLMKIYNLISIMNIKTINLSTGKISFFSGDDLLSGYESKLNFALGTALSGNGKVIFALRSTDRHGKSNIVVRHDRNNERVRSSFSMIRYVATEYGIANLFGKSIRERALAMIEIAHPNHREALFREAKKEGFLYPDQVYQAVNSTNYPEELETIIAFKDGIELKIRPIKQSDEDMMRRLFYTFSDEDIYLRYFTNIRTMPHKNMQKYCAIDYTKVLSIVAVLQQGNSERIVAEGRYAEYPIEKTHEIAFLVDEEFQGKGVASFLVNYLIRTARERSIPKLTAYVLRQNQKMIRIMQKADVEPKISTDGETYDLDFVL